MVWRNSKAAVLAVVLALTFCAGGCGASDSTTASAGATLSESQFLKEANRSCKMRIDELNARYKKWERAHPQPTYATRLAALSHFTLEARKKQLDQLKELGVPRGSADEVRKIYEAWEEGIENGEREPESMQESNERYAFYEAYTQSNAYGLTACWLG